MSLKSPNEIHTNRKRNPVFIALCMSVMAWAAQSLGLFSAMDGLIYDRMLRLRTSLAPCPPNVLIVQIAEPSSSQSDDYLLRLVSWLRKLESREIAFAFTPPSTARAFYEEARRAGDIVLGMSLDSGLLPRLGTEPAAPQADELRGIPWGFLVLPETQDGVYREHFCGVVGPSGEHPTFETLSAAKFVKEPSSFAGGKFFVSFRGGPGSLPNVDAESVLSGEMIPELVRGKLVLVGWSAGGSQPGLWTPTTRAGETMSCLEFRGHAINTLVSGSRITAGSQFVQFAVLGALALSCLSAYGRFGARVASWMTAGALMGCVVSAFLLLVVFRFWFPLGAGLFCSTGIMLVGCRRELVNVTGALHQFVDDSASQLKEKYWPGQAAAAGEEAWPLVTGMIQQTLELNKMVFLETPAGGTALQQSYAWNCTSEEIIEPAKDCTQRPYSEAINARGPIKVRDFFRNIGPEEVEYLAPLSFWGELLGFWGLSVDATKTGGLQHFEKMLREYTQRVGEVLYHRRQGGAKQDACGVSVRALMKRSSEAVAQGLRSTLGLLHERLGTLDLLIHRLGTGVLVYDVFGRVLQVNEVMVDLLRKEGLSAFGMNALDLILAVSDLDITKSRRVLQRVILNNESVSFQGRFHSTFGKWYTICLKPLFEEPAEKKAGDSEPMIPRGILCEVLDTTSVSRAIDMKTRLTGRLGYRIRHDLAAIDLCSELLERGALPPSERHRIRGIVSGKVQASVSALTECQQYLAAGTEGEELDRFPVDPKAALAAAVERAKDEARRRQVLLECKEPHFVSYVFGSAPKLEQLLESILEILLKDAAENSNVIIRMTESEDIVAMDFSNKGFGIPNDLFQEYIFGTQEGTSEEFKRLRQGIHWVEAWGGMLDAASGVGVGMHFTLHLVKFM